MDPSVDLSPDRYLDVVFDWPDGRQTCVTISKDDSYRAMEKPSGEHVAWGPAVEGTVFK